MSNAAHDFEDFMRQREAAARAYVSGDPAPLRRLVARTLTASFFGPGGGHSRGATEVSSTYERGAAAFGPGGESTFEILDSGAADDVAYWTGFQHATVHMRGKQEPVPMSLRVTEVFRREGDEWRLVHCHADTLVSEAGQKK